MTVFTSLCARRRAVCLCSPCPVPGTDHLLRSLPRPQEAGAAPFPLEVRTLGPGSGEKLAQGCTWWYGRAKFHPFQAASLPGLLSPGSAAPTLGSPGSVMQAREERAERAESGFPRHSLPAQFLACTPCTSHAALKRPVPPRRSHAPFPKLELGLGSRPLAPREPPACGICLERLREPVSLDCGHDFCARCFSTHRPPGGERPRCPECREACARRKGLRGLRDKMKGLLRGPPPSAAQVWYQASSRRGEGRVERQGQIRGGGGGRCSSGPSLGCQCEKGRSGPDTLQT